MILESGETKYIALGVVFEDYYTILSPGLEGTVGYHTKDKKIYCKGGQETTGMYEDWALHCIDWSCTKNNSEASYLTDTQSSYNLDVVQF